MAAGLCWWVGPKTVNVAVVAVVSGNGRLFFLAEKLCLAGVLFKRRPGKCRSWAEPYVKNRKMRKGASSLGFGVVLRAPFDPP